MKITRKPLPAATVYVSRKQVEELVCDIAMSGRPDRGEAVLVTWLLEVCDIALVVQNRKRATKKGVSPQRRGRYAKPDEGFEEEEA